MKILMNNHYQPTQRKIKDEDIPGLVVMVTTVVAVVALACILASGSE
ncbi:MAG: hypothetical protein KAS32_29930 [Candidatus Peribacteraceae bacterium]|nr:hypothetical protein [Candidatus Peribacteraceae bacterium]